VSNSLYRKNAKKYLLEELIVVARAADPHSSNSYPIQ
jgi:hypothetical protein